MAEGIQLSGKVAVRLNALNSELKMILQILVEQLGQPNVGYTLEQKEDNTFWLVPNTPEVTKEE